MDKTLAWESLRTAVMMYPGEVQWPAWCSYWVGGLGAEDVRATWQTNHAVFCALWPALDSPAGQLVGPCPSIEELFADAMESLTESFGVSLMNITKDECDHGMHVKGSNVSNALATAGTWASKANLIWSMIHFVMHNQPSPMPSEAVAASRALAGQLSQSFSCNDCRGFFTIGVLAEYGLPPTSIDGEAHARYWNFGHNVASEHVATTRGGHPWIVPLADGIGNPFYLPYNTSKNMWHVSTSTLRAAVCSKPCTTGFGPCRALARAAGGVVALMCSEPGPYSWNDGCQAGTTYCH